MHRKRKFARYFLFQLSLLFFVLGYFHFRCIRQQKFDSPITISFPDASLRQAPAEVPAHCRLSGAQRLNANFSGESLDEIQGFKSLFSPFKSKV